MQEEQKEQQLKISPETVMGALVLLVRFASASSRLLLVKPGTMGRRAIGFIELAGAGLFLPVFAGALGIDRGVQWINPVSGLLCICWVLQKLKSFGSESVEGYIGTTWIGARFPRSEALQVMGESVFWGLVLIVFGNFCPRSPSGWSSPDSHQPCTSPC